MIIKKSSLKLNGKIFIGNRLSFSQHRLDWELDFSKLLKERLDLYKLTTFSQNKNRPIHNWFPYLQGFSADIVELLLKEFQATPKSTVLDPWCGVGTTNLVCFEQGIYSVGVDISPLAVFVAKTKIAGPLNEKDVNQYLALIENKFTHFPRLYKTSKYDIINRTLSQDVLADLNKLKKIILSIKKEKYSNYFFLVLLCCLEFVSTFRKDGAHYRFSDKPKCTNVLDVFRSLALKMSSTNLLFPSTYSNIAHSNISDIYCGDSRDLFNISSRSFNYVITSPPYLNRDSYIAQTKLELMFGDFINDFADYRALTFSTIRSHVEAKSDKYHVELNIPQINDYINALSKSQLNNANIVSMVKGYFMDLHFSLKEIYRVLKKKGKAALVVGNSSWAGIPIEVDKVLSVIASRLGFTTTGIWVTRYKLNSAQQIVKYGKLPIRESVLFLTK